MESKSAVVDFNAMGIYEETPTGDRVGNELREKAKESGSEVMTPRDVYLAASMHYLNDEPLEQMTKLFKLTEESQTHRILDFGAGYAGDARVLASENPNTTVVCVEVQEHIHVEAQKITDDLESFGTLVKGLVTHINVDITTQENASESGGLSAGSFDHAYSMLVILHIPDRKAVFDSLKGLLKGGGDLYIEDFFAREELTEEDKSQLAGPVACPYVPSKDRYLQDLAAAGFVNVQWIDMTQQWRAFVSFRFAQFIENKARHERVHGAKVYEGLRLFYSTVNALFERGHLGGVRLTAQAGTAL